MIVLLSSGNCILFLFIISPSSLVFLIWFDITLLVSFSSLFMVSFSWLTFKIVSVTPLTNNSSIWPSPGIVSLDSLLPVTGPYFSISFYVLYFLLRSGCSGHHVVVTLWKSNTSLIRDCWVFFVDVWSHPSVAFPYYFLQSIYSLLCMFTEVSLLLSLQSASVLTEISLNGSQKREKNLSL